MYLGGVNKLEAVIIHFVLLKKLNKGEDENYRMKLWFGTLENTMDFPLNNELLMAQACGSTRIT